MVPGSALHLELLARVGAPSHRRACQLMASAARRKIQTAEDPQGAYPEGLHHSKTPVMSPSGCNDECA